MQKVISINLNGNAYQLEESGYETLREYLAHAHQQLKENPDRAEIMRDLEQAIADKCQNYLGAHKTVVSAAEMDQIVADMGPVDTAVGDRDRAASSSQGGKQTDENQQAQPKRLYRIPDGAMIAGVCNGVAAYLGVDVAITRIVFVVAALVTKGAGVFAYIVMMFVIPEANTAETRARAAGAPLNAKQVIDRAWSPRGLRSGTRSSGWSDWHSVCGSPRTTSRKSKNSSSICRSSFTTS